MLVATLAFAAGCSCSSQDAVSRSSAESLSAQDASASQSSSSAAVKLPVDFDALEAQNKDVYAWITIPGTAVDHPILQNPLIDNYYLEHDIDGNNNILGAIYTQTVNARDFSDPVTLVYGHTFESDGVVSDEMFGSLHNYEDEQFFNEHPTMNIYTRTKMLTYEIVSVYEYDDRHIMNSYDFEDPDVVQAYFDYVLNPDSMVKFVREHEPLDAAKDRIVQLSTCTHPPNDNARYLITGVLVDEQPVQQ